MGDHLAISLSGFFSIYLGPIRIRMYNIYNTTTTTLSLERREKLSFWASPARSVFFDNDDYLINFRFVSFIFEF